MKKIILGIVLAVLVIAAAGAAFWWSHRPQIVKLPNGTTLTLLSAEYGKRHVTPKVNGRRGNNGSNWDTTNDTLVVWILADHKPNQWPNFQLEVSDKANTACVGAWQSFSSHVKDGQDIEGFRLDAFPRRDRNLVLRVMSWGNGGQRVAKEQFVISNPARKSFSSWTPGPLPSTQTDDDFSVTLDKFTTGVPLPYSRGNGVPKDDPMNKCAQVAFTAQQNGETVTNWRPLQVTISDATGNRTRSWLNEDRRNGQKDIYYCQPVLWPNEPAWKLNMEFSRTSGFKDNEQWTITNLSVRAGSQQEIWNRDPGRSNPPVSETTINGIHLQVFQAIQVTNQDRSVSISFKADPDPEPQGFRMSIFNVTDDQGRALNNRGSSWGGGDFRYEFTAPRGINSVNFQIAVHKSRFVEFTVKPTTQ